MNIICSKQKLQDGISIVTKAITGKTTMPVLEGIYIQATKEGLTLIGSDMDVSIKTKVEAEVLKEGSIVIDSKIFSEIIRKLPNSDVKIEISENDLVQISCEKSVFNVVFMNAADYPSLPSINEELSVEVPQNLLKNMIKGTSFAIAQDEARPILQGILFEVKDKELNLVALVSDLVGICPIQKISIVPRGQALGYVLQLPDEDRYIYTKEELLGKMKILLAGKASEEIIFNHKSTGAKDDLKKVTEIANQMVCEYGMSNLGFMTLDGNNKTFLSEKIQDEANRIVQDCYNETLDILRNNINDLHIVSNHLFENETMTHEELKSLIRKEMC